MMTIADMEEYLIKNKHISQVIKGLNIISGVSGITHKIDNGWKENLQRISEAHPNSALAERHGKKTIKQVKTENVISKHRNRQNKRKIKWQTTIPDYMRGFDLDEDWGITAVPNIPQKESQPSIDPSLIENSNLELAKVKSDVSDIKSMMNEVMQIVSEKETITKEISEESVIQRFKDIEKIVLPFLYNLSKTDEPYIHWPNRGPIIKAQIEKILKLTRS